MKQIWPNYSYSPTTNVLTLTGLNIDRDQLLLVSAPERGRIMYNFADSATTASAFTAGANTGLTLVASTAGLTTTASLIIYFDDQTTALTVGNFPATQPVSIASVTIGSLPNVTVGNIILGLEDGDGETFGIDRSFPIEGPVNVRGTDNNQQVQYIRCGLIGAEDIVSGYRLAVGLANNNGFEFGSSEHNPILAGGYSSVSAANIPFSVTTLGIQLVNVANATSASPLVVQFGGGTVTIGAGTAQIGSVTASISNFPATQAISIASVTIGNTVTIAGTVTANTFAIQGTAVTTSNFTSTTASTLLAGFNAGRQVLTIFNEGAGNLHICPGATCTTIQYQVRLSSGDFYEVPNHQTSITHSAVFATGGGTARVTEVS